MNTITMQSKLRDFAELHVGECISQIVEYILGKEDPDAPFCWEDIQNGYRLLCPKCYCEMEEIEEEDIAPPHPEVSLLLL